MTQTYTYVGTLLPHVRRKDVTLREVADQGRVGDGKLTIEDATGVRDIVGHKSFAADQDACAIARSFTGNVVDREYYGGEEDFVLTSSRYIEVSLVDLNARMAFKKLRPTHSAKRPKEPISARLTWLLGVAPVSNYAADRGFVDYPTAIVDAADYRGRYPVDVFRDMAERVGFNYFYYWDAAAAAVGLWFRDSNSSTAWSSTLRITDVSSDVDGSTTFPVVGRAKLRRSPAKVVSGVWGRYKRGNVYRTRAATETTYEPRDGELANADTKTRTRARALADEYLYHHRTEEDRIRGVKIRVGKTAVNLVRAGQRIEAKFSRFATEGYGSFSWFRILERTETQPLDDDETYELELVLSPQEAATAGPSIVQEKSVVLAEDPNLTLDNPVTVGNVLVAALVSRDDTDPTMIAGGGWTLLGSATGIAHSAYNGVFRTAIRFYAKVATTTAQLIEREATSSVMWMYAWELAHANLTDITVIEADRQPASPMTIGTFVNAVGVALMACGVTRETDQANNGFACTPGTGWTEIKDQSIDPTAPFGGLEPWIYYAKATPNHDDLVATASVAATVEGQSVGEWGGVAVLFGRKSS